MTVQEATTLPAKLQARRLWLIACALFIVVCAVTFPFVACACYAGNAKLQALIVGDLCVAVRMLIGTVRAEKSWKAWFYMILPAILAFLTVQFAEMAGH